MYVVVVGCGRVGAQLAQYLDRAGHEVFVLDSDGSAFARLPLDFRGRTVEGQIFFRDVLLRAEIERVDALAAVTRSDTTNVVVAHIARALFKVPTVIVRNYDPRFLPVHEAFGFDTVSSTAWGARRIEERLLARESGRIASLGSGEIGVYEVRVPASWNGRAVKELATPGEAALVSLTRSGITRTVDGDATLAEGDHLHLGTTEEGIARIHRRLSGEE